MKKLIIAVLFIASSCNTSNKSQPKQESQWSGPGWYCDTYFDNEEDYQNHYNYYHCDDSSASGTK